MVQKHILALTLCFMTLLSHISSQGSQVFPQIFGWQADPGDSFVNGFFMDGTGNIAILGLQNYASRLPFYQTVSYYAVDGTYTWIITNNNVVQLDEVVINPNEDLVICFAGQEDVTYVLSAVDGSEIRVFDYSHGEFTLQTSLLMDPSDNIYMVGAFDGTYQSFRAKFDILGTQTYAVDSDTGVLDESYMHYWTDNTYSKIISSGYVDDKPCVAFYDPTNGNTLLNVQFDLTTGGFFLTRHLHYLKNCEAGKNCIMGSMEDWGVTDQAGLFFAKVDTAETSILDSKIVFSGTQNNGQIIAVHILTSTTMQFAFFDDDLDMIMYCDYAYTSNIVSNCLEILSFSGGVQNAIVQFISSTTIFFAGTTNYFQESIGVDYGLIQNSGFLLRLDGSSLDCITDVTQAAAALTFNVEAHVTSQTDLYTVRVGDTTSTFLPFIYGAETEINNYFYCFNLIETIYSDVEVDCDNLPYQISLLPVWSYATFTPGFTYTYAITGVPTCAVVDNVGLTIDLPEACSDELGSYSVDVQGSLDANNQKSSLFTLDLVCASAESDEVIILDNIAPTFLKALETQHILAGTSTEYILPLVMDPNIDEYEIEVDFGVASSFLTYDDVEHIIRIEPSIAVQGSYKVSVLVYETSTEDELSTSYEFTIQVSIPISAFNFTVDTNQTDNGSTSSSSSSAPTSSSSSSETRNPNNQTGEDPDNTKNNSIEVPDVNLTDIVTARIYKISGTGVVTVEFSESIKVPENYTLLDSEDLHVDVLPGQYSSKSLLGFNWTVTQVKDEIMKMKLDFENPLYVSNLDSPDQLEIKFIKPDLFEARHGGRKIPQDYTITQNIFPQMINSTIAILLEESGDAFETLLSSLIITNFAANLAMSTTLNYIWAMIHCQQLLMVFPLFRISFPGNALMFYSTLIKIANFNYIPIEDESIDAMDIEDESPYSQQFEYTGYPVQNIVPNLGTIFLMILGMVALFIGLSILNIVKGHTKILNWFYKLGAERMYYNRTFRFVLESFLEISITSLVAIQFLQFDTFILIGTSVFTIVVLILVVSFPFIIGSVLLFKKISELDTLIPKFGVLYIHFNYHARKLVLLYMIIFVTRRFMVALACVMMNYDGVFQLQFNLLVEILTISYLIYFKPFWSKVLNYMEYFNELCILAISYHMLFFTDFTPDKEFQYFLGWDIIVITLFNIFVNMILISVTTLKNVIAKVKVLCKKVKAWHAKRKKTTKIKIYEANQKVEEIVIEKKRPMLENIQINIPGSTPGKRDRSKPSSNKSLNYARYDQFCQDESQNFVSNVNKLKPQKRKTSILDAHTLIGKSQVFQDSYVESPHHQHPSPKGGNAWDMLNELQTEEDKEDPIQQSYAYKRRMTGIRTVASLKKQEEEKVMLQEKAEEDEFYGKILELRKNRKTRNFD